MSQKIVKSQLRLYLSFLWHIKSTLEVKELIQFDFIFSKTVIGGSKQAKGTTSLSEV